MIRVDFISKRVKGEPYAGGPDDDWIRLTDFCEGAVYVRPQEVDDLIALLVKAKARSAE